MTRRPPPLPAIRLARILAAMLAVACSTTQEAPPLGAELIVRRPQAPEDDPFKLAGDHFVAITAEVPGRPDGEYRVIKPYKAGTSLDLQCSTASCAGIPYAQGVQVRVELWSSKDGAISAPVVGRGRSVPIDQYKGGAAKKIFPYVTRTNRFAPIEDESGQPAVVPGKAGAAVVTQRGAEGAALIIGGADPLPGKTDPFDPTAYANFSNAIYKFLPNERKVGAMSDLGPDYQLKVGRAFHTAAVGKSGIAVVGGYGKDDKGIKLLNTVEFLDFNGKTVNAVGTSQDLKFARAGATVISLFDNDDYFLILGGRGDPECKDAVCASNTWELWHAQFGNVAQGGLNSARWNHAAVRLPATDGGYVMLIGGENADGVAQTFEVVQFSAQGLISFKGQQCQEKFTQFGPCSKSAFFWEPLTQVLQVPRTLPGAAVASVPRGAGVPDYRHVYIVGGFEDKAHTKAVARMDVFDIDSGDYFNTDGFPLLQGRGAPMVTVVPHGPNEGQVLIAGGSKSVTEHLQSAEFVYVTVDRTTGKPVPSIQIAAVENDLIGGARVLGSAVTLNTGHVLIVGGVGKGTGTDLVGLNDTMVWNPF